VPRIHPRARRPLAVLFAGTVVAAAVGLVVHFRTPKVWPERPPEGRLRVATYNIRAALGGLDRIADDLRPLNADLIALQEVERGIHRQRSLDQAGHLATALGMESAFAGSFPVEQGEHGIAVLSRYPILDTEILRLPRGNGRWPRVALKVRVEAPGGPLLFVALHLARPWFWPFSNTRARLAQIGALLDSLEGEPLPVIVAGDFNSLPFSAEAFRIGGELQPTWKPWRDGWATSFSLDSIGWPLGSIKIDHILHDRHWQDHGTWVAPRGASDHQPVISDLSRVPEEAAGGGKAAPDGS